MHSHSTNKSPSSGTSRTRTSASRPYVSAKERLIALLEEERSLLIIHQGVTRGLDPDFKLKPSGVERLGDVPKHWEVCYNLLGK